MTPRILVPCPPDCRCRGSCSHGLRPRFRFRELLEKNFSDVAHSIVRENGKLLSEARGSLRRGLDVVEFACGIPSQLMGQTLTDISRDVDCHTILEPLGVVVGIPPFNFPALIPLWMMSVAVACGNTFILKPAEKAPLRAPCSSSCSLMPACRRVSSAWCRAASK